MTAISLTESQQLIALEKKIEAGQKTFEEVGLALAEIRDSKLYRADHKSFEDYCRAVWGWDKSYCGRLIVAASVSKAMPIGTIKNEAQARELAKAKPEDRRTVLEQVQSAGPITAATIAAVINEQKQPDPIAYQDAEAKRVFGNLELPKTNRGQEAARSLAIQTEEWMAFNLEELPAIRSQAEITFRQLSDKIKKLKQEKMK